MIRKAIFRPLALASVLAVGIAVVWVALGFWTYILAEHAVSKPRMWKFVKIRQDGTPVIETCLTTAQTIVTRDMEMIVSSMILDDDEPTYETLDGKEVLIPKPHEEVWRNGAFPGPVQWTHTLLFRKSWSTRIRPFSDGGKPAIFWHFIHDGWQEGAGYFMGYHSESHRQVGYLGTAGFSKTEPPRHEHFSIDGRDFPTGGVICLRQYYSGLSRPHYYGTLTDKQFVMVYVCSENRLFEVDLRDRTVKTLFEDPELLSIGIMEWSMGKGTAHQAKPSQEDTTQNEIVLLARLKDRVLVLNEKGEQITSFPILKEIAKNEPRGYPKAYSLPDDQVLLTQSISSRFDGSTTVTFYWLDPDRKLIDRKQALLEGNPPKSLRQDSLGVLGLLPMPGLYSPVCMAVAPSDCMKRGLADSYSEAIPIALAQIWPALLLINLVGLVLVWLCVRRQRKFAMPWTKTWATFVFLFGLPGMLAYLYHRRWPEREACPDCGRNTPLDRDACAFCDTPFAPPEPVGIEVFA